MTDKDRRPAIFSNALLAAAMAFALTACSTSPDLGPRLTDRHAPQEVSSVRHAVVRSAGKLIGTPYRYGGSNRNGFDCSGLVQYTHRQAGVDVPRTTGSQWHQARVPERQNLLPGDLLFFTVGVGSKTRHVGIYEGKGIFIHSPSSGKRVSRASLENPYWASRLTGTKTFL